MNKNFDKIIRFDVKKNKKIIEWKSVKDKTTIDYEDFDISIEFVISNKKIIEYEKIKEEIVKFENANFDFFVW